MVWRAASAPEHSPLLPADELLACLIRPVGLLLRRWLVPKYYFQVASK